MGTPPPGSSPARLTPSLQRPPPLPQALAPCRDPQVWPQASSCYSVYKHQQDSPFLRKGSETSPSPAVPSSLSAQLPGPSSPPSTLAAAWPHHLLTQSWPCSDLRSPAAQAVAAASILVRVLQLSDAPPQPPSFAPLPPPRLSLPLTSCPILGVSLFAAGAPGGSDGKESACSAGALGSIPELEEERQPTPAFLPGEPHGRRSLAGYIQSMGSQSRP